MGRYASKAISSFDQIQSLTIADLNKENAEEFAKQLGSHVEGIGLNIKSAQSGKTWRGQNLLGKALMRVRDYLSKQK